MPEQHGLDRLDAGHHRLLRPADLLDRHGAEGLALLDAVGLLPAADLEALAAETHHDDAAHVGVGRVAPLRALQDLVALAMDVERAAAAMHERNHAVDAGIIGEDAGALDLLRHEGGDRGGAVHAGQDADVVARSGPALLAAEALEGGARLERQHVLRLRILGMAIIALEGGEVAIVRVDMFAGRDIGMGEADDLAELDDGLALGELHHRHLVPPRDARLRRHPLDHGADRDRIDGDDHVVGRIQAQMTASGGGVIERNMQVHGLSRMRPCHSMPAKA